MTDEHDRRVTPPQPPRAFDDDATTETPLPEAGSRDADSGDGGALDGAAGGHAEDDAEPEVVEEHAEPEAPAAFEDLSELPALLEALLFVADHPIDANYLARAVEVSVPRVEHALDALAESLRGERRGIRVQRGPAGVQLVSAPEAAAQVERFLGLEANRRLSQAALETLAIIAYRQPVTRGQVDTVRGVSSDGAIATLRARDLIESAGQAPGPGRPMLFRTTQRFLEHFGLERPGQLPPLPEDVELPPAEIQATLGLDEEAIAQALAPREEEVPPPADDTGEAGERGGMGDAEGPAQGPAAAIPSDAAPAEDASSEEGEPPEPAGGEATEGAAEDEAEAAIGRAIASAVDVEISSDVQALSEAAEHAFEASRERLTSVSDHEGVSDRGGVSDHGGDDAPAGDAAPAESTRED